MRNSSTGRWRLLTIIPILLVGCLPGLAEVSLNGITLNSNFLEVLEKKGAPHFVGPSLEDVNDVSNILTPPPMSATFTPDTSSNEIDAGNTNFGGAPGYGGYNNGMGVPGIGAPGMGNPGMGNPGNPGIGMSGMGNPGIGIPGNPGMGIPGMGSGAPSMGNPGMGGAQAMGADKKPKGQFDYIVWLYQGNAKSDPDPNANYNTYVIFDKKSGAVIEVIVWATKEGQFPHLQTPGTIGFGTSFTAIVANLGNPKPLVRIGNYLVCPYPKDQVTYSVDTTSKKVIGIAIGNKSLTAIITEKPETKPAEGGAPGIGLPGMPGGMPGGMNPGMPGMMPPSGVPSMPPGMLPGIPGQSPVKK